MNDFNYPRQSSSIKSWIMRKYFCISSNKKSLFDFFIRNGLSCVQNCRYASRTLLYQWRYTNFVTFQIAGKLTVCSSLIWVSTNRISKSRITTPLCGELTEPMGDRWIPLKWPPMRWVCPCHDDIMGGLCIHCYLHGTAMVHSNGRLPCCLSYPKVGI